MIMIIVLQLLNDDNDDNNNNIDNSFAITQICFQLHLFLFFQCRLDKLMPLTVDAQTSHVWQHLKKWWGHLPVIHGSTLWLYQFTYYCTLKKVLTKVWPCINSSPWKLVPNNFKQPRHLWPQWLLTIQVSGSNPLPEAWRKITILEPSKNVITKECDIINSVLHILRMFHTHQAISVICNKSCIYLSSKLCYLFISLCICLYFVYQSVNHLHASSIAHQFIIWHSYVFAKWKIITYKYIWLMWYFFTGMYANKKFRTWKFGPI